MAQQSQGGEGLQPTESQDGVCSARMMNLARLDATREDVVGT